MAPALKLDWAHRQGAPGGPGDQMGRLRDRPGALLVRVRSGTTRGTTRYL